MKSPRGFVKTEFVRKRSDGAEDEIGKTRRKNRVGLQNSEKRAPPNGSEKGHLINGDHQGRLLDTRRNAVDVEKAGGFPGERYTGGLSFHK